MNPGWEIRPDGSLGAALTRCLNLAILAPSIHNSQPWRFRLSADRIDVLVDLNRRLWTIDPRGREALISVGACVLNLRVAILAAGRTPTLRLLPDPRDAYLVARITLGRPQHADPTVEALAAAIPRRHTNRRPFRDIEVRDEVLDELAAAARIEGGFLATTDDIGRDAVLGLVRSANERQREDPRYVDELREWTDPERVPDSGIPASAYGPWDDMATLPLRDFGLAEWSTPRRQARFEPAPTVVVLYSSADSPMQWLRTGQALQRLLLTATVRGVSNTPMTAPTELPELRALLSDPSDTRVAQMVLRLGYGIPGPATPRRPLNDIMDIAAPSATTLG